MENTKSINCNSCGAALSFAAAKTVNSNLIETQAKILDDGEMVITKPFFLPPKGLVKVVKCEYCGNHNMVLNTGETIIAGVSAPRRLSKQEMFVVGAVMMLAPVIAYNALSRLKR